MRWAARPLRPRWVWAVVLAAMCVITGIGFIQLAGELVGPGGYIGIDGRRLIAASATWWSGGDPYLDPLFIYAPPSLLLALPFTLVPLPVALGAGIALGAVLVVTATLRSTSGLTSAFVGLALVAALSFWPVLADALLGNVTIELVFAMWLVVRGNRARDGILLGVLAAAFPKPMLLPFVLWALVWRRPAALSSIASGGITWLVTAALVGTEPFLALVRSLTSGSVPIQFGGNHSVSTVSPVLGLVTGIVFAVAFLLVLRTRGPVVSLIWALGTGIMVSPYAGDYALLPMLLGWPPLLALLPTMAFAAAIPALVLGVWFFPFVATLLVLLLLLPRSLEQAGRDPTAALYGRNGP